MNGIPKYIIELALQLIREKLSNEGIYSSKDLAVKFFRVKEEEVVTLHKKCKFITYMCGYSIPLTKRSKLYIMISTSGEELVQIGKEEIYEQFEYRARRTEFPETK